MIPRIARRLGRIPPSPKSLRSVSSRAKCPHRPLFCVNPVAVGYTQRRVSIVRSFHASRPASEDRPFKLADIGEGITEVEIIKWTVKEGDTVEEFDVLCEVQSDKSTVELTAPFPGKVHHIAFNDGDTVNVGQVICVIKTDDGSEPVGKTSSEAQSGESSSTSASSEPATSATAAQGASSSTPQEPFSLDSTSNAPKPTPKYEDLGTASPQSSVSSSFEPHHIPIPPTDPDEETHSILRTSSGEVRIPPPPQRTIVRPTQIAHEKMSGMDRALLASLRAAAEAGQAVEAAQEAATQIAELEKSQHSPQSHRSEEIEGAEFLGEGSIVRREKKEEKRAWEAVPERIGWSGKKEKEIVKTSPAVRTMAARLGVKLEDVIGTGDDGRITQQDVQNAVHSKAPTQRPSSSQPGSSTPPPPTLTVSPDRQKIPEVTKVEFGRTRKAMYRAMGDMGHVPHFGYSHTLNLTPLLPYIKSLNATAVPSSPAYIASDIPAEHARNATPPSNQQKTTLLSFLVKGLILAMEEHPIMRSRAKEQGSSRFLDIARDGVIGIAVSDPKYGLVTPSLPRFPPSAPLSSITSALSALRSNPTKPSTPPNLTISSVGGLGESRDMMPVLPPGGGLAICAVGRAKWEVEWKLSSKGKIMDLTPEEVVKGGHEAVLRCNVGWSGDHRVLEGAELIAFTETWKKYIEQPELWLRVD